MHVCKLLLLAASPLAPLALGVQASALRTARLARRRSSPNGGSAREARALSVRLRTCGCQPCGPAACPGAAQKPAADLAAWLRACSASSFSRSAPPLDLNLKYTSFMFQKEMSVSMTHMLAPMM